MADSCATRKAQRQLAKIPHLTVWTESQCLELHLVENLGDLSIGCSESKSLNHAP